MIFTGLAVAVAFRAKFWNIGAEGQLLAGAVAGCAVGELPMPGPLAMLLMALAGAAAGALFAFIPAILRVRLKVDDVVSSLLLNSVAYYALMALIEGPWKDSLSGYPISPPIQDSANFPVLLEGTRLHLGVVAALFRGTFVDHAATTMSLAGMAMPNFWLGPVLALVFSVELGWLPVSGSGTWAHLVLPSVTLGAALAAITARMTRASLGEELRELYVLAARARGLSPTRAVVVHAFRNSLIPVVTILGLQLGAVLTGTIITETIFAWPGVGRLLIQAINFRDYPLVQGCILLIAVTYVTMNLIVDVLYAWLDPRIRHE